MSHLYRQYMRLVAKWPLDANKDHARNLKYFLEHQAEELFPVATGGERTVPSDYNHHKHMERIRGR